MTPYHEILIPLLARNMRPLPTLYMELGVYEGPVLKQMAEFCERCIGIDKEYARCVFPKNVEFYRMTTKEFALLHGADFLGKVDILFIDADHSHAASTEDFNFYFEMVRNNGLIFLHDTYPLDESMASPGYCGDSWRTAVWLRECVFAFCEVLTLPIPPGLTIVRKHPKPNAWSKP